MTSLAGRWLRPWLGPLRELKAFRARRAPLRVDAELPGGGRLEGIVRTNDGLVSAHGWSPDLEAFERAIRLRVGGEDRSATHVFRLPSPEIERTLAFGGGWLGAVAEWVVEPFASSRRASVILDGREVATLSLPPAEATPYGHLHTCPHVLGRGDIYAFGPPSLVVSSEVLALARRLPPPVLDFGCGAGALVAALRREGIEAFGLEIDDSRIRSHLLEAATPYVTLYEGVLPSPFATGQFASVICSEVLEHLPDSRAALAELARLATRALLVTVPDMSAIPRGFAHAVVPWHLLESTHVNFFTQASLHAALVPHAARIEMSRIGLVQCDRLQFYGSLAALVERPQ